MSSNRTTPVEIPSKPVRPHNAGVVATPSSRGSAVSESPRRSAPVTDGNIVWPSAYRIVIRRIAPLKTSGLPDALILWRPLRLNNPRQGSRDRCPLPRLRLDRKAPVYQMYPFLHTH